MNPANDLLLAKAISTWQQVFCVDADMTLAQIRDWLSMQDAKSVYSKTVQDLAQELHKDRQALAFRP